MQFSTAFALLFHACSARGALASSDRADPASARKLKAKNTKSAKGSRKPRGKYLMEEFPCLGPLANETTVAAYTEQDNTKTISTGTVMEVWKGTVNSTAIAIANVGGQLVTKAGQKISRAEATRLCVTKCEEVLEGCTLFRLDEYVSKDDGAVWHECHFYGDESVTAQFPTEDPQGVVAEWPYTVAMSVFHKGAELALPEFHGCDVPAGSEELNALIKCRVGKFAGLNLTDTPCEGLLASASSDFEAYVWPGVQCTFEAVSYNETKLIGCLGCLTEAANVFEEPCNSNTYCGEDSFITKKCPAPETCTADGQTPKAPKDCCGDDCPVNQECVSKIATSFLCQSGGVPKFDANGTVGGCMHSDTPGHYTYLADSGTGDYKCPEDASVPAFM